jgi:hypothetical protein
MAKRRSRMIAARRIAMTNPVRIISFWCGANLKASSSATVTGTERRNLWIQVFVAAEEGPRGLVVAYCRQLLLQREVGHGFHRAPELRPANPQECQPPGESRSVSKLRT